jgi:hypothetical protein
VLVFVVEVTLVLVFFSTTLAPATKAPEPSVIVPLIPELASCAGTCFTPSKNKVQDRRRRKERADLIERRKVM